MKPEVRPAPSERSTANQLYSGVVPLWATAAAQAAFFGWMAPLAVSPSFQQRYVRLPGAIIAPCAWAGADCRTATPVPVSSSTAAATHLAFLIVSPSSWAAGSAVGEQAGVVRVAR